MTYIKVKVKAGAKKEKFDNSQDMCYNYTRGLFTPQGLFNFSTTLETNEPC